MMRPLCAVCKRPIPIAKLGKIPSYIDGKEVRQFCSSKCRKEYIAEGYIAARRPGSRSE